MVTQRMITGQEGIKWIIGGIHADNGKAKEKWEKLTMNIDKLDEDYIIPKILKVDVNADISDIKYLIWKKEQKIKGWNIIESKKWTRKGHTN